MSLFGELVLEKRHQALKRAVKQSNNKDAQIQAMKDIALSDWQGRMALVAHPVIKGQEYAFRACFRLLRGRESVAQITR